jgi:hypothetical protein
MPLHLGSSLAGLPNSIRREIRNAVLRAWDRSAKNSVGVWAAREPIAELATARLSLYCDFFQCQLSLHNELSSKGLR